MERKFTTENTEGTEKGRRGAGDYATRGIRNFKNRVPTSELNRTSLPYFSVPLRELRGEDPKPNRVD
jgi:hypothetical protein